MVGVDLFYFHCPEARNLQNIDIFDMLCLDPYEEYTESMLKSRLRKLSIIFHPDKQQFLTWEPPKWINQQLLNACKEFIWPNKTFLSSRWQHIVKKGRVGWKSSWDMLQEQQNDRNKLIPSYTARFGAVHNPKPTAWSSTQETTQQIIPKKRSWKQSQH